MTGKVITELYAWITLEADGGEGVIGCTIGQFGMVPLVGADQARMESYRPYALSVAREIGVPIKLVRFSAREVLEEIVR